MIYITVKQSPACHQMTLEEFLFQENVEPIYVNYNLTNTRTYEVEKVSDVFLNRVSISEFIRQLENFNQDVEELYKIEDRHTLYRTFYIPKKSGGLRKIDAPNKELMEALSKLKTIFECKFHVLYHTSAFAYVKHRSTLDAVKRHQGNNSKWFAKYDLHNFFGSTTLDFVLKMFSMVFPFSEIMKTSKGCEELSKALELTFLDGVLPQGTPISPMITNIMMIPIDFKLTQKFRSYNHQRFVNTRYADDFIISSKYDFDFHAIEDEIVSTLNEFEAPFTINKRKTRYGSSAGANWNLGVMLNKDNNITVGHKKKKQFQTMMFSYVKDKLNGIKWEKQDVQVLDGYRNYYHMVEPDAIDGIIRHMNEKLNVDICSMIKRDLKA